MELNGAVPAAVLAAAAEKAFRTPPVVMAIPAAPAAVNLRKSRRSGHGFFFIEQLLSEKKIEIIEFFLLLSA
jgi:hypothetical protein